MGAAVDLRRNAKPGRDDWQTPEWILERVRKVAPIAYDPCTHPSNPTKALAFSCLTGTNGLETDWFAHVEAMGGGLVFMNPPFTNKVVDQWVDVAFGYAGIGVEIVTLTSMDATQWWRRLAESASARAVPWKRVNYRNPDTGEVMTGCRFSSALHYFGPNKYRFCDAFSDVAEVQILR